MSNQELHDLLIELEAECKRFDIVDQEKRQRIEELVESLEEQKLYPRDEDRATVLKEQVGALILEYEEQHPNVASVLNGISQVLQNFKA